MKDESPLLDFSDAEADLAGSGVRAVAERTGSLPRVAEQGSDLDEVKLLELVHLIERFPIRAGGKADGLKEEVDLPDDAVVFDVLAEDDDAVVVATVLISLRDAELAAVACIVNPVDGLVDTHYPAWSHSLTRAGPGWGFCC